MRTALLLPALGTLALLAGCGKPATRAPAPESPAEALQARAALAGTLAFTGTYAVSTGAATVQVFITPAAYRVDVVERGQRASLYGGTGRSAVACTVPAGKPTLCYTVAAAGSAVPAAFDAGVQRIFTRDLPALATTPGRFSITAQQPSAAVLTAAPAARCFAVSPLAATPGTVLDSGTYCLDAAGLPVQLTFKTGTLTLTSHGPAPTTAQLTPPVAPVPLPSGAPSGPSVPAVLPSGSPTGLASGSPVS